MRRVTTLTVACILHISCSKQPTIVRIDTDLPVPEIASKMLIEIRSETGIPIDSREIDLPNVQALPASFAIDRDEPTLVRIRVYPRGRTLAQHGVLVPDPAVTVDRIVRIPSGDGERFGVLLRGECAGVPADIATGVSCASEKDKHAPLASASDSVEATLADSFREPCLPKESNADRICIPGGVFILGDREAQTEQDPDFFLGFSRERLVHLHKFFVDRHEITVGRYRTAVQAGFKPGAFVPQANDAALDPDPTTSSACTYSTKAIDREAYPLNCLPQQSFQEFCEHEGGSLPTEAEWEYVAARAGSTTEHTYPHGDAPPTCDTVVHARAAISPRCKNTPIFPPIVGTDGSSLQIHDITPLGVAGMGGSLSEFVRDVPKPYDDACWADSSFHGRHCDAPHPDPKSKNAQVGTRGSSWAGPAFLIQSAARAKGPVASPFYGARCVYTSR